MTGVQTCALPICYDSAMRAFLQFVVFLLVLAVLVGAGAWFWAGRSAGPTITVRQPGKFVGQNSSLELMAEAPEGKFTSIDVTVEQSGKTFPVFTLDQPQDAEQGFFGKERRLLHGRFVIPVWASNLKPLRVFADSRSLPGWSS